MNKRPIYKVSLNDNRSEFIDEQFTFILMGGRVIDNAVERDEFFTANLGKEERSLKRRGETIIHAINRYNFRKFEIEYIISKKRIVRSIETETIETIHSNLIYSKYDKKFNDSRS